VAGGEGAEEGERGGGGYLGGEEKEGRLRLATAWACGVSIQRG
jgi:hypothetical protein